MMLKVRRSLRSKLLGSSLGDAMASCSALETPQRSRIHASPGLDKISATKNLLFDHLMLGRA